VKRGNSGTKRYSEMKFRKILERTRNFPKQNDIFQNQNYFLNPGREICFVFANVVRFRKIAFSFQNFAFSFQNSVWFRNFQFHFRNALILQNSAILFGNVVSISECGLNSGIRAVRHHYVRSRIPFSEFFMLAEIRYYYSSKVAQIGLQWLSYCSSYQHVSL